MRSLCPSFWIGVSFASALAALGVGDEPPRLTVRLVSGQTLRGTLDPRTSAERLWLKFGDETTAISRGLDWRQVTSIQQGDQPVSPAELVQRGASSAPATSSRKLVIPPGPSELPAAAPPRPRRTDIATIALDAWINQWDQDVDTDGLSLQVTPLDSWGTPVEARGTLTVELYAIYRVPQHAKPHGRGRDFRLVNSWTTTIHCEPGNERSNRVQLPYAANHPEWDSNWSPFGVVHARLVIPGHGVFRHSIDGIRLRSYAPTRDLRQLQGEPRYFASEFN